MCYIGCLQSGTKCDNNFVPYETGTSLFYEFKLYLIELHIFHVLYAWENNVIMYYCWLYEVLSGVIIKKYESIREKKLSYYNGNTSTFDNVTYSMQDESVK